jgi:hypothetical protein
MRRARVLVFSGWLSAAGMLVNAVACNDSVGQSSAKDASEEYFLADASVTPDADALAPNLDAFDGDSGETTSDATLDETSDAAPETDARPLDEDQPTDSSKPSEAAPSESGADSSASDSMNEGGPPIPDGGMDAGEAENDGSAACGDAAVGATQCLLEARGPACLACALQEGCLDPLGVNASCDQFVDGGQGECLATLSCVLGASCGVTVASPSCLCGSDDASACAEGTEAPAGVCADTYFAGFGTHDVPQILASFNDPSNPSADANLLVQCLQFSCTGCF